jgi:hypothetical protein
MGYDTVATFDYAAWHDAFSDNLRDSATAEVLQALSISTSTRSSLSCRRAATGAIGPQRKSGMLQ